MVIARIALIHLQSCETVVIASKVARVLESTAICGASQRAGIYLLIARASPCIYLPPFLQSPLAQNLHNGAMSAHPTQESGPRVIVSRNPHNHNVVAVLRFGFQDRRWNDLS